MISTATVEVADAMSEQVIVMGLCVARWSRTWPPAESAALSRAVTVTFAVPAAVGAPVIEHDVELMVWPASTVWWRAVRTTDPTAAARRWSAEF